MPVRAAVDFARRRMGAERVVVVGAMGGSPALMSAAGLTGLVSAGLAADVLAWSTRS